MYAFDSVHELILFQKRSKVIPVQAKQEDEMFQIEIGIRNS